MTNTDRYQLIIPSTAKDYTRNHTNYKRFFEFLPIREIVFIGPEEVGKLIYADMSEGCIPGGISYINENDLISFVDVKEAMRKRLASEGYNMAPNSKPGWYYQQFLKMYWSQRCEDEYYLIWDADTIPLKVIDFFDENGRPYFDVKKEYNPRYFRTIGHLFDGMTKVSDYSYISEHMLFNTKRMREMIDEINRFEDRGNNFCERIFNSVEIMDVSIGFSEFETYGTYMETKYPGEYSVREWKSMRAAGYFFEPTNMNNEDIEWLALDYDAATFESYNQLVPELHELFYMDEYRRTMTPREIYQIILDSGIMRPSEDGMIVPD